MKLGENVHRLTDTQVTQQSTDTVVWLRFLVISYTGMALGTADSCKLNSDTTPLKDTLVCPTDKAILLSTELRF